MTTNAHATQAAASNLLPFDDYLSQLGKTRCTGWRWREMGIVETVNLFGRWYITRDEIARFEARVLAGEFAKRHDTGKAVAASLKKRGKAVA